MSGDLEAKSQKYTQISVQKFYEWTISKVSFCMRGIGEKITSPGFSFQANEEVAWCLTVYPYGVDEESKEHLSVFLVLLSRPEKPVLATFEFWIINLKGEKYQSMKSPNVSFLQNQRRGFKKYILRDFLLSDPHWLLSEDQLTLCCKVSIVGDWFCKAGRIMTIASHPSRRGFIRDLGELWENSLFTDCSLVVAGHEFRAHKAILAARSPVFRAMFEHEMQERLTNHVEIHELDPQVFKEMMGFIYTGRVPHLHSQSMATGLLAAADKYGLERLRVMCEDALIRNLSLNNAVHTLILADLHSTEQLKTQALYFIVLHASEIFMTLEWKSMLESHPHLVDEVFHSLKSVRFPFLEPSLKCLK